MVSDNHVCKMHISNCVIRRRDVFLDLWLFLLVKILSLKSLASLQELALVNIHCCCVGF